VCVCLVKLVIHRVPKLVTPLQISCCKIVNTRQIFFTKCKTFMETIILKEELLLDTRNISKYSIFQQDSAPAYRAKETVDLLLTETPAFIPPTLWPPNSPDLNPVDYKVWLLLQEQVYKVKVNDVDELHQRIQTVWDELDQRIIGDMSP